jgi:hypothetical protein
MREAMASADVGGMTIQLQIWMYIDMNMFDFSSLAI